MGTSSQTVGPFFGYSLPYEDGPYLVPEWHPDAIRLHGRVLDGAGDPVPDALVEIWQADTTGQVPRTPGALRRAGHDFAGFGRSATDAAGHYWFSTVRPGGPYIAVLVSARGLLKPVATRVYFADVPEYVDADRRHTLVAEADGDRSYVFDIRLRGDQETVFFAL